MASGPEVRRRLRILDPAPTPGRALRLDPSPARQAPGSRKEAAACAGSAGPGPQSHPIPRRPVAAFPEISSPALLRLYVDKQYGALAEKLLEVVDHFKQYTYVRLIPQWKPELDALVGAVLYLLTRPDFEIPAGLAPQFVKSNHIIANMIAMSSWGTSDPQVRVLLQQPRNLVKLLTLYNPRNTIWIDPQSFFAADAKLASIWYTRYPLSMAGATTAAAWENLRRHLAAADDRFVLSDYSVTLLYFFATDVDPDQDRKFKALLNSRIRAAMSKLDVRNRPRPRSVAVLTAKWFPGTAVYRSSFPFLRALAKHYELTLVHLGAENPNLDTSLFREVRRVWFQQGRVELDSILSNDFQVAYYPDIGMSSESIWLSNARLAPIQVMGYGHPVSTFGSQIDYFIGGADVELVEHAATNYSERLVLIPGIGAHPVCPRYQPKHPPPRDDRLWINCPWGCSKVNYPMLLNLRAIRDRARKPVCFQFSPGWGLNRYNCVIPFIQDIDAVLGPAAHVFSNRGYDQYMEYLELGELALDSYPFGGYNTIVDALYLGKPVVTYEGTRFYNRAASALLRRLGLEELIAATSEQYIDKAVRLVDDDPYRRDLAARIRSLDLRAKLFDTDEPEYFRRAIDYLIEHHEALRQDPGRAPIFIGREGVRIGTAPEPAPGAVCPACPTAWPGDPAACRTGTAISD